MNLADILAQCIEVGDCLEWQGTMGQSGSAGQPIIKCQLDGKSINIALTREVWKLTRGPIPQGCIVYRTCCNDRCVGCLALGVRGDAMRQRRRLGLAGHTPATRAALTLGARSRANVKNSVEKAREVRRLVAAGAADADIARLTGVGSAMVADIRCGRAWCETSHASSVFAWRPSA